MDELGSNVRELIVYLAAAGLIVPIFSRLRVSPVLGFIVIGVLIGPSGLIGLEGTFPWLRYAAIVDLDAVMPFAHMGIAFLLFMIGLELSAERLWPLRKLVFGLGFLQVAITASAIGFLAWLWGNDPAASIVLGCALALSSTAIVMQLLGERGRTLSDVARVSFAVLLFQDLAVVPILFLVDALAASPHATAEAFAFALLRAVAAIAFILGIGHVVIRPIFRLVAAAHSRELFLAATLLVIIAASLGAAAAGLSVALGAFLAGLLFADTEFRREIQVDVEPFKGLLLGVFFVFVGMQISPAEFASRPGLTLAMAAGLYAMKATLLGGLAWAVRLPPAVAVESGLLLGQGSEFAFVIAGLASSASVISPDSGQLVLVVAAITMMATPVVARMAEHLSARIEGRALGLPTAGSEGLPQASVGHVIIVGYGRVGRLVSEMLAVHQIPCLAIDRDPYLVGRERRTAKLLYFGDATRPEFLRRCGISRARALVATMDSPRAVELVVEAARRERPDMTIVARARDAAHAAELYQLGATDAVPETVEASLQLSEAVLVDIGLPMGLVIASIHEKRDQFRQKLQDAGSWSGRHSIRRKKSAPVAASDRQEDGPS